MNRWKIVRVTDDSTQCEVCGRQELKSVVHLVHEDGSELMAGSSCAARKVGITSTDMRGAVKAFNNRLAVARGNFPDHFRFTTGQTIRERLRMGDRSERGIKRMIEFTYRQYMKDEGFYGPEIGTVFPG